MNTLTSTTIKSVYASIVLHVVFIVLGSWAFYNNSVHTLELTGKAGDGGKVILLSDVNFVSKKSISAPVQQVLTRSAKIFEKPVVKKATSDSDFVANGAVGTAVDGGSSGSGVGPALGNGAGSGSGDFDQGHLFRQIKNFYETRLGPTLNIRENQLIKIKLTLNTEGDILEAILIQGKLEMSVLRRIISVAKNIPLKSFWKSSVEYPKEIIVPLFLTPGA